VSAFHCKFDVGKREKGIWREPDAAAKEKGGMEPPDEVNFGQETSLRASLAACVIPGSCR
jgi:hypothetical protein